MHIKYLKVFVIALFVLGISANAWASAPVVEWSRTFGGSGSEHSTAIRQTSDGGFIVVGSTDSNDGDVSGNPGNRSIWVVRLNASGDIV